MAEKYTDDKLYRVVRKDGSHLNTKVIRMERNLHCNSQIRIMI